MLIPDLVIYNTVRSLFDIINTDWEAQTDKTKTILYDLFHSDDNGYVMSINKFNYFEQAKGIFIKSANDVRKLQVTLGYNLERIAMPTVHILLPNEQAGEKGIGYGEGYQPYEVDEETGTYKRNFTDVYNSTYSLMITSDNSSEVVLIYHALKNLFVAIFEHFELSGLRNISFGGQDLQFNNELVPPNVFHRNLNVTFFYETTVNELLSQKLVKKIQFGDIFVNVSTNLNQGGNVDLC